MATETIPTAVWEGTFTIMGVPLRCSVLNNGQRVINAEDIDALFDAMGDDERDIDREALQLELDAFGKWQHGRA